MSLRDVLRVPVGQDFDLAAVDPESTPGLPKIKGGRPKRWALEKIAEIGGELATLQEQLFATAKVGDSRARVLLVLQAMDCGGKDGTVKKVAGLVNPQGLSIAGFGKPNKEELSHDFLWRIRRKLPTSGQIGVFNRSHYEDVLVVRVHELAPERTWRGRYATINEFEEELANDGVAIIKVMLHISKVEQAQRLDERLHDPTKYWKFNPSDLNEREFWPAYQEAYAAALSNCSTEAAPWYVVPANRKWYRDWAVATLLHDTLVDLGLSYPPPSFDVETQRERLKKSV
jgi:PPK2 family polyphosphate:nucleotide phosphotransferase